MGKTGEKTDCEKFLAFSGSSSASYLAAVCSLPLRCITFILFPPYIFKYHLFTFIYYIASREYWPQHIDAWIPCSKLLSENFLYSDKIIRNSVRKKVNSARIHQCKKTGKTFLIVYFYNIELSLTCYCKK